MKTKSRHVIYIFSFALAVRFLFILVMGIDNNYALQPDSKPLVEFADNALDGNFDFDYGRFIASPGFPFFAAAHKFLFGHYWSVALVLSQLILSSLSAVYLYKISRFVFKADGPGMIAALIYCLFPLTFWYVHTFCQETLFQCLFIFSIYHLIASYSLNSTKHLVYSAILFSLSYLTKSHVLLFSVFIPFVLLLNLKPWQRALKFGLSYSIICVLFSIPYGLYHLEKNETYVLSSNGAGILFYLGNTNAGYVTVVDVPPKNSDDYRKMKDITVTAGYFNGNQARYDSLMAMPQHIKQRALLAESFRWMKQNPAKLFEIKIYDLAFFLMPGVSYRHYEYHSWLATFVLSLPVYALAYAGLAICLRRNFRRHFFVFGIFMSMLLFSVIFYVQNRFRTITLEPFYIVYAGYCIHNIYLKYGKFLSPSIRKRK